MKLVLLIILSMIFSSLTLVIVADVVLLGFAKPMIQFHLKKKSVMFRNKKRFEIQTQMQCAGFSSAYVLRDYGHDVSGMELYDAIPHKRADGSVYPTDIPKILNKYGHRATYHIGNLIALKNCLSEEKHVIALIRYETRLPYLHFIAIVGYDEDYIYVAESLKEKINCNDSKYYNRKISVMEFKKLWNTSMLKMPFHRNTFFAINQ